MCFYLKHSAGCFKYLTWCFKDPAGCFFFRQGFWLKSVRQGLLYEKLLAERLKHSTGRLHFKPPAGHITYALNFGHEIIYIIPDGPYIFILYFKNARGF